MSLTAFKRKSVINYGSKRSGTAPGGVWLPQGPFGHATKALREAIHTYGAAGFSINGGHRNVGGVDVSLNGNHLGKIIGISIPDIDDEEENIKFDNEVINWIVDNEY